MRFDTLSELLCSEYTRGCQGVQRQVAIFETITINLTPELSLYLTYNTKNDQLKVQLADFTEIYELDTLEPWLLRQRIITMCIESNISQSVIDRLTGNWGTV